MKKNQPFKMPTPVTIMGRSSSITNSFVNGIIPCIEPTPEEIKNALNVLKMSETDVRCAYCGDVATEWDHLNPLIKDKKPTGYISEIHNLVPACGKCNQSKGNSNWEQWMRGDAELSPTTRGIKDIDERIERLKDYETEFMPRIYDFEEIVGKTDWDNYWKELDDVIDVMKKAQGASDIIKKKIRQEVAQKNQPKIDKKVEPDTGETKDYQKYTVNSKGPFPKGKVAKEAIQLYAYNNPEKYGATIVKEWLDLNVSVPNFIETEADFNNRIASSRDLRATRRSERIQLPCGDVIYVSNQYTPERIQDLMTKVNAQPWGIIIS